MSLYSIAVRFLDDRPDAKGYRSAFGRELPLFYVDAGTRAEAFRVVRQLVEGRTDVTRTFVDVCNVYEEDATVQSQTFYAPGWDAERCRDVNRVRVMVNYVHGGAWINESNTRERDADEIYLTTEDGTRYVTVSRGSRGNWSVTRSAPTVTVKSSWTDRRFTSSRECLDFIALRLGVTFERVTSFEPANA